MKEQYASELQEAIEKDADYSATIKADAFAEDVQRAHTSGMNEHIAKPLNIENLMLLKKYL